MKATNAAVLALALLVPSLAFGQGTLHTSAHGKSCPALLLKPQATSINPPGASPERFLALDVFAGAVGSWPEDQSTEEEPSGWGWDVGATVVFPVRWLGFTGAFGRHPIEGMSSYQVVGGPQYQSQWVGSDLRVRYFGELLVGVALSTGGAAPQSSLAWVFGFGFDFSFVRVKFENVLTNVSGVQRRDTRAFVGGVLPICLRACEDSDLILSGR